MDDRSKTPWRKNPLIYEINTWTWLHALTQHYAQAITLGNVPDAELDALTAWGFDAIWLMGVWERSPTGRKVARAHPGLQDEYRQTLPDLTPDDIVGSPYAVHEYRVDARLGDAAELADFRARLAQRGLRLVLDFVPNHVALDHPWLVTQPEYFLRGTAPVLEEHPDRFFWEPMGARIVAHGRDPYFPAWTDTAQLNAFSAELRTQALETLLTIAAQCDAVRCDMAMLVTNRVFAQTWGDQAGEIPAVDYWPEIIPVIKKQHPHFLFVAEVYWDMEWELQQQGFDYTYDKRLYERMVNESARSIHKHLWAERAYQERMVRFIENHDEPRALNTLGAERNQAAAILITTLPGACLLHEGQLAGHQIKLPVQIGRRPPEPANAALEDYYRCLLQEATQTVYHQGEWRLHKTAPAWDLNASHRSLLAYSWRDAAERRLVVVNYSAASAQGLLPLPDFDLAGHKWYLHDVLPQVDYERNGDEMIQPGLYIDLQPWQAHIFVFREL